CQPSKYRRAADNEVTAVVAESSHDLREPIMDFTIYADPRSRFYDPSCPDCPPMPPDDPIAHRLMRRVDGKAGYKCWDCDGHTPLVDSPFWQQYLPRDDQGAIRLDLTTAVEVSRLNSPLYQDVLEDLYLNALGVTFERFRFDTQFFGGYEAFFTADGPDRVVENGQSSSVLQLNTRDVEMRKLYASGGELVVGLANSLMWQFSGPDTHTATTVLDFSIVQPLLRGAGRDVVLENLTQSERDLLAGVRRTERFYRGFFAQTAIGGDPFSSGFDGAPSSAAGFYGLLQTQQVILNLQTNVNGLRESLEQLESAFAAGRIDRFQVDLARQALYNAESNLLEARNSYQTRLDSYKIQLGLPPECDVVIDDPLLRPFELVDPALTSIISDSRGALVSLQDTGEQITPQQWQAVRSNLAELNDRIDQHYEVVRADLAKLEAALPERRATLRRLADELTNTTLDPRDPAFSVAALDNRIVELQRDWQRLQVVRQAAAASFSEVLAAEDRRNLFNWLIDSSNRLLALQLIQARAKLDTIVLTPLEVDDAAAVTIASINRRDWKNARAELVDQWRQITVTKNDLESRLDVVFNGDISNVGDNPLKLQGSTGRLQVGLQWDAPLTRLVERNVYRTSIINYQRARRDYYTFEDNAAAGLRSIVRDIRFNQINFELNRAAVFVAIAQVDLTQLRLNEPPKPGAQNLVSNTAARDLVDALSGLLSAQNSFVNDWVQYEMLRISLDYNLGTMQLDERGMWVDPGEVRLVSPEAAIQQYGPSLSLRGCECPDNPPALYTPEFADQLRAGEEPIDTPPALPDELELINPAEPIQPETPAEEDGGLPPPDKGPVDETPLLEGVPFLPGTGE
ncbi:MAG: TolC family protein, partial [Pirellulales bacterium]